MCPWLSHLQFALRVFFKEGKLRLFKNHAYFPASQMKVTLQQCCQTKSLDTVANTDFDRPFTLDCLLWVTYVQSLKMAGSSLCVKTIILAHFALFTLSKETLQKIFHISANCFQDPVIGLPFKEVSTITYLAFIWQKKKSGQLKWQFILSIPFINSLIDSTYCTIGKQTNIVI